MIATLSLWPDLYYICHYTIHDAYPFPSSLAITLFSLPFLYPFLFSLSEIPIHISQLATGFG